MSVAIAKRCSKCRSIIEDLERHPFRAVCEKCRYKKWRHAQRKCAKCLTLRPLPEFPLIRQRGSYAHTRSTVCETCKPVTHIDALQQYARDGWGDKSTTERELKRNWRPNKIDRQEQSLLNGALLDTNRFAKEDGTPDDDAWLEFIREHSTFQTIH